MRKLHKTLLPLLLLSLLACGAPDAMELSDAGIDEPTLHSLNVVNAGEGQAELLINGELCAEDPCEHSFAADSTISLEVRPSLTSSFRSWSADCGTANICEFTLGQDSTYEFIVDQSGVLLDQTELEGFRGIDRNTVDSLGNTYILGSYRLTSPPPGIAPKPSNDSSRNAYCAKLAPDNSLVWTVALDYSFPQNAATPNFVGVDDTGAPYVVVGSTFTPNGVISRLDPDDGSIVWSVDIAGQGQPYQVAVDGLGNVFLASRTFDAIARVGSLFLSPPSDGDRPNMLGVITSDGAVQHLGFLPTLPNSEVRGLAPLQSGGVMLSRGGEDHVLEQYSASGALTASVSAPGSGQIALAPNRDVVVLGTYREALSWGTDAALQIPALAMSTGLFLGRLSPNGEPLWLRSFPTTNRAFPLSRDCLGVSSSRDIFVCGMVLDRGQIDLGEGLLPRFDEADAWMVSYSSDGEYRWSEQLASNSSNFLVGLVLEAENTLRVVMNGANLTTQLGSLSGGAKFQFRQ